MLALLVPGVKMGGGAAPVVTPGYGAVFVYQWIWSNFEKDKKKQ